MRYLILLIFVMITSGINAQGIDTIKTKIPIRVFNMYFPDSVNGIAIGDHPTAPDPNYIIHTTNAGKSWSKLATPFEVYNAAYPHASTLHATAPFKYFRSSNLGLTWDSLPSIGRNLRFIDPAFGYAERRRTTDFGLQWEVFNRAPVPTGAVDDAGFQNTSTGWMSGSRDEGCFGAWSALYITEDSANSWQLLLSTEGKHFPLMALRAKNGNWLITFYDEDVYLKREGESPHYLGKFGSRLVIDAQGNFYGCRGYRSVDNGESFQKWVFTEDLEDGVVVLGSDSSVYFTSHSDTRDWQEVGHIIYRVYSPSLAFGGKSSVARSTEPVKATSISMLRGENYRLPANNGYELFNLLGLRVSGSNDPTEHLTTTDLTPGLYLLRIGDITQRLLIY